MIFDLLAQRSYGFEGTTALLIFTVCFIAVVGLTLAFVRLPLVTWLVIGILMMAALSAPTNQERTAYLPTWILPVQQYRAELQLGLCVLLGLFLFTTGRLNLVNMPAQAFLLLMLGLFMGTMQFVHDTALNAAQSMVFAAITIPATALGAVMAVNAPDGPLRLVRGMLTVASFWAGACCVQFVINPEFLVNANGRFWGMLSNPQLAGMFIAPVLTMSMWAALNDPNKRLRILWFGLMGIYVLFAGWTGSRMCAVLSILGWMFVLGRRLGGFVLLAPFVGGLVLLLGVLAQELQIGANLERLTSTENTRDAAWARQIEDIMTNPFIGVGWNDVGATENSYLGIFAGYGIIGFLFALTLLLYSMWLCLRLLIKRKVLPPLERSIADLTIAVNAVYFAGANFEGYMLARSSSMLTFILIYSALAAFLLQRAGEIERGEHVHAESDDLIDEEAARDYGPAPSPPRPLPPSRGTGSYA